MRGCDLKQLKSFQNIYYQSINRKKKIGLDYIDFFLTEERIGLLYLFVYLFIFHVQVYIPLMVIGVIFYFYFFLSHLQCHIIKHKNQAVELDFRPFSIIYFLTWKEGEG